MQNFMELDIRKFLDRKSVTYEVWGLKTCLEQLGPKRRIKSEVWNSGFNCHKQDPIFSTVKI